MGGTPVFADTRVPVQTLLDYLEAGDSIDEFLVGFPSVSREQVIQFLEHAKDRLVTAVRNADLKPQAIGPVAIWDGEPARTSVDHDSAHDEG